MKKIEITDILVVTLLVMIVYVVTPMILPEASPEASPASSKPIITVTTPDIQVAFSPSPDALKLVIDTIYQAKKLICVAAYSFTSKPIADALIQANHRGVRVVLVLDRINDRKRPYPAVQELIDDNITVALNKHYAIMHDKYMLIDSDTVETGSFNYTEGAASRNAENVIVIHDALIQNKYFINWMELYNGRYK